ncbi:hypothetical protein HerbRD11066_23130 [Herbidospora sp. RD11066]
MADPAGTNAATRPTAAAVATVSLNLDTKPPWVLRDSSPQQEKSRHPRAASKMDTQKGRNPPRLVDDNRTVRLRTFRSLTEFS